MKETKEIWTPAVYIHENGTILDFTGLYEVSDHGRVKSLNYNHTGKERVLKRDKIKAKGKSINIYYQVALYKNNKRYQLPIYRIVLSSFKRSEYFSGAVADHIVARTEVCDDSLSNLHWVTCQQNNSTDHAKELLSKAHTNHPSKSKRVRVTDLTTGKTTEYPSAKEAGRSLGIPPTAPATYINQHEGFYKKMNLMFSYIV